MNSTSYLKKSLLSIVLMCSVLCPAGSVFESMTPERILAGKETIAQELATKRRFHGALNALGPIKAPIIGVAALGGLWVGMQCWGALGKWDEALKEIKILQFQLALGNGGAVARQRLYAWFFQVAATTTLQCALSAVITRSVAALSMGTVQQFVDNNTTFKQRFAAINRALDAVRDGDDNPEIYYVTLIRKLIVLLAHDVAQIISFVEDVRDYEDGVRLSVLREDSARIGAHVSHHLCVALDACAQDTCDEIKVRTALHAVHESIELYVSSQELKVEYE